MKRSDRPQVTYFVQRGRGGPIKIGISSHIESRLRALATGSAEPLVLLGVIDGDHERTMHEQLAEHRLEGEWFSPSPEVLEVASRARLPVLGPAHRAARKATPAHSDPPKKQRRGPGSRWLPARSVDPPGSLAHAIMRDFIRKAVHGK